MWHSRGYREAATVFHTRESENTMQILAQIIGSARFRGRQHRWVKISAEVAEPGQWTAVRSAAYGMIQFGFPVPNWL
jgi:hypothetical protein